MRKSEIARNIIALAQANGTAQSEVIAQVMRACEFKRGLASVYVKGNWAKTAALTTATVAANTQEQVNSAQLQLF